MRFVLGYRHDTAYSAHVSTACRMPANGYIYYNAPVPPAMRNAVLRPSTDHICQQVMDVQYNAPQHRKTA
jgi:hypothetical protein